MVSMRLYSRGQVIFFSLVSAVGVLALAVILGFVSLPRAPSIGGRAMQPRKTSVLDDAVPALELPSPSPSPSQTFSEQDLLSVDSSTKYTDDELQNIEVYQRLNSSVVNVTTETVGLNWFLEPVPQGGGVGSGSIIDDHGYVLTNYHVVEKAYKVTITLADGTQFPGKVVGSDPENDLAIVKFDPGTAKLTTIAFGSSSDLKAGQKVLAIGNPFGLNRTLTTGIVSGLGRPIKSDKGLIMRDMIQTDAAINPGNSGGPLLDSHGRMIGINTMIFTPTGGSVGIGFAIPIDTARRIVPELVKYGEVRRGWIDIVPVQLDANIVAYAKLPVSKGVLVSKVVRGGNADRVGIRGGDTSRPVRYGRSIIYLGGDIIVAVDGAPVTSIADLFSALEDTKPGQTVPIGIQRGNSTMELHIKLDKRPQGLKWE